LQCKSFKWYLENVYSDQIIPDNLAEGSVTNEALGNDFCLDALVKDSEAKGGIQVKFTFAL
jgi:hypothetical protein